MNNVINQISIKKPVYSAGSIWRNPRNGNLHMLAKSDMDIYSAIDFVTGNRWTSPTKNEMEAVDGLDFVAESATITVAGDAS